MSPTIKQAKRSQRAFELGQRRFAEGSRRVDEPLEGLDLETARAFVRRVYATVEVMNREAGAEVPAGLVAQEAFRSLWEYPNDRAAGFALIARRWAELAGKLAGDPLPGLPDAARVSAARFSESGMPRLAAALATYQLAVEECLREECNGSEAEVALRALMSHLELSYNDLGRIFDVAGETVRRWEQGSHRVPPTRLGQIRSAAAALDRLLAIFRPESLPQVIRRDVELFEDESALGWILRGRIGDVADRYEMALAYQA
jgi:hypothetical protein